MGAHVEAREGRLPPAANQTARSWSAIDYELPVASAQVKSCVLIAGLLASGRTSVREPSPSRDHTERILRRARVPCESSGTTISVSPVDEIELEELVVPGDPSSAAFIAAAASIVPRSRVVIARIGLNWTRTGFFRIAAADGRRYRRRARDRG